MKKILLVLTVCFPFVFYGQVRPDQRPIETNPNNSNWEFYSQKDGTPLKRTTVDSLGKNFIPQTFQSFWPMPTGNTQKNGLVRTAGDSVYWINRFGSSFLIASTSDTITDADWYETGTNHPPYAPNLNIYSTGAIAGKKDYYFPGATFTANNIETPPPFRTPTSVVSWDTTEASVSAGVEGLPGEFIQFVNRGRESYLLSGADANLSIGHKGVEMSIRESVETGPTPDVAIYIEAGGSGNVAFPAYPDIRDDGVASGNYLWTDASGNLRSTVFPSIPPAISEPNGQVVYGTGAGVDSDTSLFWNGTLKRLGVGGRYPQYAIDVKNSDISVNEIFIGRGPGAGNDQNTRIGGVALFQNTTGIQNTSIGWGSMYSNTTGDQNTAVGRSALGQNTTGYQNAAFGWNSLNANTTGAENTAFGWGGISSNTTGSENTAIGRAALYSSTTGGSNTAVGHNSLLSNATGGANTAVGRGSMYSNTTGATNTAVGYNSLNSNTTGGDNIAIGYNSLSLNTSGGYSIGVGSGVLGASTTGGSNVGIGYMTLPLSTTGYQNTAIGHNAAPNITTGGGNVIIGVGSGGGITTGEQNTIVGSLVGGLASNLYRNIIISDGAGNQRIRGLSNGNIGIGTTNPVTAFHANGKSTITATDATGNYDPPFRVVVDGTNPGVQSWVSTSGAPDSAMLYFEEGIANLTSPNGLTIESASGNVTALSTSQVNLAAPLTIVTEMLGKTHLRTDANESVAAHVEEITVVGHVGLVEIELDYTPSLPSGFVRSVIVRNIGATHNVEITRGAQTWEFMTMAGTVTGANQVLTPGQTAIVTFDNTWGTPRNYIKVY